ncbi:MAG: PQQ-binding-like beta-propeller repeat protein [Candidatus Latescibacteria bacterium]|nr:PQQ-binding-like beta-propeller repeat protein [Rhodospirillales bacterium]MBT5829529.1 PQQ-binding-like beta-propeller repeat protein [Candidatus Latescibacterota bacterium]
MVASRPGSSSRTASCVFGTFPLGDLVLHAFDAETGEQVWQHNFETPTLSAPAVSGTGLWTGTCDGYLHAFSGSKIQ